MQLFRDLVGNRASIKDAQWSHVPREIQIKTTAMNHIIEVKWQILQ